MEAGYTSSVRKRFYDGLAPDLRAGLLAQIRNLWTHTSTALEGNTLSLGETDFILSEDLTIAGKPLKDHREVVGHARAIDIVYTLLDRDRVARLAANLPVLRTGAAPIVVPKERRLEYLRAIAAYQLSIPGFPNFDDFPINSERAAFTALCSSCAAETRSLVAAARRLQAERDTHS